MKPVKVLVLDESAVERQTLRGLLSRDERVQVVAITGIPKVAAQHLNQNQVDVLVLDLDLKRHDALRLLKKLMKQRPIPVVAAAGAGPSSGPAIEAMAAGAVEVIKKPRAGHQEDGVRVVDAICAAGIAQVGKHRPEAWKIEEKLTADVMLPPPSGRPLGTRTEHVVVMGASTGGTDALREVLTRLPVNAPGIVVVQHMPEQFTGPFADRLDGLSTIHVREARDGDPVQNGQALIAPGNRHAMLVRTGRHYRVQLRPGPLVARHRPSVDVLFRSAAQVAGENATGILMTGMGDDGAAGLLEMRQAGAYTVAQDKASCVVFGMPGVAIQKGAACAVVPLSEIPAEVIRWPVYGATIDMHWDNTRSL